MPGHWMYEIVFSSPWSWHAVYIIMLGGYTVKQWDRPSRGSKELLHSHQGRKCMSTERLTQNCRRDNTVIRGITISTTRFMSLMFGDVGLEQGEGGCHPRTPGHTSLAWSVPGEASHPRLVTRLHHTTGLTWGRVWRPGCVWFLCSGRVCDQLCLSLPALTGEMFTVSGAGSDWASQQPAATDWSSPTHSH